MKYVNSNENLDTVSDEEKKKSNGVIIVFSTLFLGVILGFFFSESGFFTDKKEDVATNCESLNEVQLKAVCNYDVCETIIEDGVNNNSYDGQENLNNDEIKSPYEMILDKVNDLSKIEHLNRNINEVSEFTNQELLQFALNYVKIEEEGFTLDDINKIINLYFGRTVEGEDIYCLVVKNEVVYYFDKNTNTFKQNDKHSGHGGGDDTPIVLNKIVDVSYKNSQYVVQVKKAFAANRDIGLSTDYYRTYSDMLNEKNKLFEVDILETGNDIEMFAEADFYAISNDKLATYEYVFEYQNNDYVLVSYKIGK